MAKNEHDPFTPSNLLVGGLNAALGVAIFAVLGALIQDCTGTSADDDRAAYYEAASEEREASTEAIIRACGLEREGKAMLLGDAAGGACVIPASSMGTWEETQGYARACWEGRSRDDDNDGGAR